jgi:heat shock protein HslJ
MENSMRRFLLLALPLTIAACAGAPADPAAAPGAAAPSAPAAAANGAKLTGVVWSWQRVRSPGEPPDPPERYTVEFAAGGRIHVRTDCILAGGSWMTDGAQMKISSPVKIEKVACQPAWYDREFLGGLESVESHELRGGELVIKTRDKPGTMRFVALPR